MIKSISNKTTKKRIFQAIDEEFFLNEKNCKRYIKKINPLFFDDENFIYTFIEKIMEKNMEYIKELDSTNLSIYNSYRHDPSFVAYHFFIKFVAPYISKRLLAKKDFIINLPNITYFYTNINKSLQLDPDIYNKVLTNSIGEIDFKDFPEELRKNKDFALTFINNDELWLIFNCSDYFDSTPFLDDYDIVSTILEKRNDLIFSDLSDEFKDDKDLAIKAIKQWFVNFKYVSDRLKNDDDFMNIMFDIEPWFAMIHCNDRFKHDYNLAYKLIKQDPLTFCFIADELRDNETLALMAINNSGTLLEFCSARLRKDKNLVLKAINENYMAFKYASDKYKNHFDAAWDMLLINPDIFRYVNKKLKDDYMFSWEAVKLNGENLKYVSNRLKDDIPLVKLAYNQNIDNLKYASNRIKQSPILLKL